MRILIISYYFPPYNTIGAVRVGKTAKYLHKFGHEVFVITSEDQNLDNTPLEPTLALEIPKEQIIYTRAKSGTREHNQSRLGIKESIDNLRNKHFFWWSQAYKAASYLIQDWRPDIIYASALPTAALIAANRAAKKYRIPWVCEMRDLWADNPYINYSRGRRFIEEQLERWTLSSAHGFVTISKPLADKFDSRHHKPIIVALNGFDPEDIPSAGELNKQGHSLRIIYTGSIYEGKRDPSLIFEALSQLGPLSENIKVIFYGPHLEIVQRIAKQFQVEHLIEIHNPVSHKEALAIQANADIALLLLWDDSRAIGTYTGKLFEYIGSRRPILMIGPPNSSAGTLIKTRELGCVTQNPNIITKQLLSWLKEKQQGGIPNIRESSRQGLSREEQTKHIEKFLLKIVSNQS